MHSCRPHLSKKEYLYTIFAHSTSVYTNILGWFVVNGNPSDAPNSTTNLARDLGHVTRRFQFGSSPIFLLKR